MIIYSKENFETRDQYEHPDTPDFYEFEDYETEKDISDYCGYCGGGGETAAGRRCKPCKGTGEI